LINLGPSDFGENFEKEYFEKTFCEEDLEVCKVLIRILELKPDLKVIVKPYTAPAKWKTTKSIAGGELKEENEEKYASYLANLIEQIKELGVKEITFAPQNEPSVSHPDSYYPTQNMSLMQQIKLSRLVKSKTKDIKIMAYNDSNTPQKRLLADIYPMIYDASSVGVHGYSDTGYYFGEDLPLPWALPVNCTESTEQSSTSKHDGRWAMNNLIKCLNNKAVGYYWFNLMLDKNFGPLNSNYSHGCRSCIGVLNLIEKNSKHKIQTSSFYNLMQATKELASNSIVLRTDKTTNLELAVVQNSESYSIFACNNGEYEIKRTFIIRGKAVEVVFPPLSPTTFLIPITQNP
jgi:O-glycosyl hydrolase